MLDDRIISRIIDPPRDDKGRLKVRPKGERRAATAFEAFRLKWVRQGMAAADIRQAWDSGLRA